MVQFRYIICIYRLNRNLTMRSQSLETDLSRDPDPQSPKMRAGRMIKVSHVASMRRSVDQLALFIRSKVE